MAKDRTVEDVAETVKGQLSYITYLLNVYSDNIHVPREDALIGILEDVNRRLVTAQTHVVSMIDAYTLQPEEAVTSKRHTTNRLHK